MLIIYNLSFIWKWFSLYAESNVSELKITIVTKEPYSASQYESGPKKYIVDASLQAKNNALMLGRTFLTVLFPDG